MLEEGTTDRDAPLTAPVLRALASLRAIAIEKGRLPLTLIQACAATLTELEFNCGRLSDTALEQVQCVLPRCTRLESLTLYSWLDCPPAAWLGLSQLHTLRGVSLAYVPTATIAAALPRLHTLHLHHQLHRIDFSVAGFYDELLPRLRSFHLEGAWPETSEESQTAVVRALPLLEDLKWCAIEANPPRQLMGARPSTLSIYDMALDAWLQQAADGAGHLDALSPLARVQALTLRVEEEPPEVTSMGRLLRATPQLRKLTFDVCEWEYADNSPWFLSKDSVTPGMVFATGLFHLRLRHVAVNSLFVATPSLYPTRSAHDVPVPDGCGVLLRQRHFPRLRRFSANDEEYPVWIPRRPPQRRNAARRQ
jgi:hypothetical protein